MIVSGHPRKDFERGEYLLLDGEWQFRFGERNDIDKKAAGGKFDRKINVPYAYQSKLSGIGCREKYECVWYGRNFNLKKRSGKKYLLNFGAVDYRCKVWVNGGMVGSHRGGYSSFRFDVTDFAVDGENTITLCVEDKFEEFGRGQARGKQTFTCVKPFGCVYTESTGIWQSVWIDVVGESYIKWFRCKTDIDSGMLSVKVRIANPGVSALRCAVKFKDLFRTEIVRSGVKEFAETDVNLQDYKAFPWEGIALWFPETPNLYDLELELLDEEGNRLDTVKSYFGMKKVETRGQEILLNNAPYYQKLILNQGYFSDGWYTPNDEKSFAEDVKLIKEMGFNGLRMHQKLENPEFLYECDRQGLLVWQELPSAYAFEEESVADVLHEWRQCVLRDVNHPSILTYVTLNESWGVFHIRFDRRQQALANALYYLTKALDDTRLVIGNDGWEHVLTDVVTLHDYSADGEELSRRYQDIDRILKTRVYPGHSKTVYSDGYQYEGQPIVVSEFGGVAIEGSDGWGYDGKVKDSAALIDRYAGLIRGIRRLEFVCGYCYTQFTDIEAEVNGLLLLDRTPKCDVDLIKKINENG